MGFCVHTYVWVVCSILWLVTPPGRSQEQDNNWNTWESWNNKPVDNIYEYFLDKNTDCDGRMREVGNKRSIIYGHGAVQTNPGPLSCSLTLNVDSLRDPKRFRITVQSAKIKDEGVQFYIYDGSQNGGQIIDSFEKNKWPDLSYDYLFTTGGRVSFRLVRMHEENLNYDIEIHVDPVPTTIYGNGEDCIDADQYGCYDYYRFQYKFPNEIIIGVIGGAFLLCFVITAIIVLCCYRKYTGRTKKWKETPLSFVNTGASLPSTIGTLHNMDTKHSTGTAAWDKNSKNASLPHKSRMIRPSEDVDSVFESVDSMPVKKRYSPPHRHERNRPIPRTSTKREERKYRDDSEFDDMETAFVQGNDDHPQNVFIERVMEPRVKPQKTQEYYDDSPQAEVGPSKQMITVGTDPGSDSEEDDEEGSDENNTEMETEEEDDKNIEAQYSKPVKNSQQPPAALQIPQSQPQQHQTNAIAMPAQPAMIGLPPTQFHPQPHAIYPSQPMVRNQFLPPSYNHVMLGDGKPVQPVHMPIAPTYIGHPYQLPRQQQPSIPIITNPNDQPMYSYIVQRGYTPHDGRYSPVSSSAAGSTHSNHRLQTDESDFSVNLDSGVELMKRQTEV